MRIHNISFSQEDYITLLKDICNAICLQHIETNNSSFLEDLQNHVIDVKIIFNTQILLNFYNKKPLSACTVLPLGREITTQIEKYAKDGLGFGISLDDTIEPIKLLDKVNDLLLQVEDKVLRRVAAIAVMSISNPYIEEFIEHKKNANFSNWRMNLSVKIDNHFLESVLDAHKNNLNTTEIKIYETLAESMLYCGEPGILFSDRINDGNPIPHIKYIGMAPCAELAMSEGERCHFAYINVSKFIANHNIDYNSLIETVRIVTVSLDNLLDISLAKDYNEIVFNKRRISIGICGLAELFIKLRVVYGSSDSEIITNNIMSVINYYSKETSVYLAHLRGSFPLFKDSLYMDASWFLSHGKGHSTIISMDMWQQLWEKIQQVGIRNCATTALPPTGNSAHINNTTYSIEPIFDHNHEFIKDELKKICFDRSLPTFDSVDQMLSILPPQDKELFLTANQISIDKHLAILKVLQGNIDESISKTINISSDASIDDVKALIQQAYAFGLKGITIFKN